MQELAPLELAQIRSLEADLRLLDDRIRAAGDGLAPRSEGDLMMFRRYRDQLAARLNRVSSGRRTQGSQTNSAPA